jgi:hypothetical protein
MPFCSLVIGFLICGCVLHASAQDDRATQVHVEPSREVGRFHGMGCGAIFYEAHITSLSKRGHHAAQKALYDDMFTKVNTRFLQLMIRHDHEPKNDNADPWKPEFKDEWFAYALETLAAGTATCHGIPRHALHAPCLDEDQQRHHRRR